MNRILIGSLLIVLFRLAWPAAPAPLPVPEKVAVEQQPAFAQADTALLGVIDEASRAALEAQPPFTGVMSDLVIGGENIVKKPTIQLTAASNSFPGQSYVETISDPEIENLNNNYKTYQGNLVPLKTAAETNNRDEQTIEYFKNNFMTFAEYMYYALYDETFGYYSSGNVKFVDTEEEDCDFITCPNQLGPNFGAMIAYQAYAMWLSMMQSKDIAEKDIFTIIEFGAGEGGLARSVLDTIKNYADQEKKHNLSTLWNIFFRQVRYIIGEKSPRLRDRQTTLNREYIASGKMSIRAADAREPQDFTKVPIKGLIVSNELPDAFPVHKIWQMPDGLVKICVSVPTINAQFAKTALDAKHFAELEKKNIERTAKLQQLLKNDPVQQAIFSKQNADVKLNTVMLITKQEWIELKRLQKNQSNDKDSKLKELDKAILFIELYFDSLYFPEAQSYCDRHQNFITWLAKKNAALDYPIWYMNYAVASFIAGLSTILDKGFVITIDYGFTSIVHQKQLSNPTQALRLFPRIQQNVPTQKFAYFNPGLFDMTTDVNFSDLCIVGMHHTLRTIFYGHQSILHKAPLATSKNMLLAAFDLKNIHFAARLDELVLNSFADFKHYMMLIQQKNNTKSYYRLLHPSEALFPAME